MAFYGSFGLAASDRHADAFAAAGIREPTPKPKRLRVPREQPDQFHSFYVWCKQREWEEKQAAARAAAQAAAEAAELDWCIQPRLTGAGGWAPLAAPLPQPAAEEEQAPFAWDPCLLSHPGQADPEPALAASPIVQPLSGTAGEASCRHGLCTEEVEARQAAAASAAPPATPHRRHRSLLATLRSSSSQLAHTLRSLLASPAHPAASCSGGTGRRPGCAPAAAEGWGSTPVNWTAVCA